MRPFSRIVLPPAAMPQECQPRYFRAVFRRPVCAAERRVRARWRHPARPQGSGLHRLRRDSVRCHHGSPGRRFISAARPRRRGECARRPHRETHQRGQRRELRQWLGSGKRWRRGAGRPLPPAAGRHTSHVDRHALRDGRQRRPLRDASGRSWRPLRPIDYSRAARGRARGTAIHVVSLGDGQQVQDGFALIEHIAPNTKSDQSVRAIAAAARAWRSTASGGA